MEKTCVGLIAPLEWSPGGIASELLVNIRVGIAGRRIPAVLPADVQVSHSQFLSLISDAHAGQEHLQHIHQVDAVLAVATTHSPLIVISHLLMKRIMFSFK